METIARLKKAHTSAQKVRLVIDQVRGLPVGRALETLKFSQKKAARIVEKLLNSAISNAEHNEGVDVDELTLSTAYADEGQTAKRIRPRAKGRANRILKRTCHITLAVSNS